jgi:hypothetical protein
VVTWPIKDIENAVGESLDAPRGLRHFSWPRSLLDSTGVNARKLRSNDRCERVLSLPFAQYPAQHRELPCASTPLLLMGSRVPYAWAMPSGGKLMFAMAACRRQPALASDHRAADDRRPLVALALSTVAGTDLHANDYAFDQARERQLRGPGRARCAGAISTWGVGNVVRRAGRARTRDRRGGDCWAAMATLAAVRCGAGGAQRPPRASRRPISSATRCAMVEQALICSPTAAPQPAAAATREYERRWLHRKLMVAPWRATCRDGLRKHWYSPTSAGGKSMYRRCLMTSSSSATRLA